MQTTKSNRDLGDFLVANLPKESKAAYETVALLNYPIADRSGLRDQLEEIENLDQDLVEQLSTIFAPNDFALETVENALEKLQYGLRQRFLPVLFDEAASLDGTGDIVARVKLPDISGIIETLKAFMDHIAYCRGLQAELTRIIKKLRGMTPWWSAEADTLRDDIRALKRTIHFECAGIIG